MSLPFGDARGDRIEAEVPAAERHGIGQYFTPLPLVRLVLDLLEAPGSGAVLDPSCGSGRFLAEAARRWGLPAARLLGFDTDPRALEAARASLPGADLRGADFLNAQVAEVALVIGNPPYVRRARGRDLYVDFLERALSALRPGGRLAFVLSNAWLDVGYGAEVRRMLLGRAAIEWLVESTAERWFPGAKVHTMVLVCRREDDPGARAAARVRFARLDAPLPGAPRVVREVAQGELPAGRPWGPLLRASELYVRTGASGRARPLGELASLRRGFTTNDNRFFYPPPGAGIEPEFLAPLMKSPRRVPGVRATAGALPDRVFLCALDAPSLRARGADGALAWIRAHRDLDAPEGWRLRDEPPARQLLVKGYGRSFRQPLFDRPVHCDQQLYALRWRGTVRPEAGAALLNCSWTELSLEFAGRVNFGDGVLWLSLQDAREQVLLPDPAALSAREADALSGAFAALPDGGVPPADELDADPAWGPARRRLDAVVGELLGLGPSEQEAVRAERAERCRVRLRMAR